MKLKSKIVFILFFFQNFISCIENIYAENLEASLKEDCQTAYVTIENPIFKSYILFLIEKGLEDGAEQSFSNGLLECYEKIVQNNNEFSIDDLKEAFTELIEGLQYLQTKAPRPIISNPIVGPPTCDLSEINTLLHEIRALIVGCCNNSTLSFNSTFTALYDLQNTLTVCCENITNEFDATFTVLYNLQNTLTACCLNVVNDFNGTFSALHFGFNSTFSLLSAEFGTIDSTIEVITTDINTILSYYENCCVILTNEMNTCCQTVVSLLSEVLSTVTASRALVSALHTTEANTNCILNDIFPITTC